MPRSLARLAKPFYSRAGYVYFAERPSDGAIKIGFSTDVRLRLKQHAWTMRQPIRLLGAVVGTVRLERELHSWFAAERPLTRDGRLEREWFTPSQTLRDWIAIFATTMFDDLCRPVPSS